MRRLFIAMTVLTVVGLVIVACGWRNARSLPIVRYARVDMPQWPSGTPPMRVVLASDIHMGNTVGDASRLDRVVEQINALEPDLILLAGDFIAGHEADTAADLAPELIPSLAKLRPRLATIAVLGNHDHWTGAEAVRRALAAAHVEILSNEARRFGPLTVVGVDDIHTRHADEETAVAAGSRLSGAQVLLTHSPDIVPALGSSMPLVLAGHTHCGQIVVPMRGALAMPSNYGQRYRCGVIREGGLTTVVTAGVGTSVLPLRYGAPPDLWVLTLGASRPRS